MRAGKLYFVAAGKSSFCGNEPFLARDSSIEGSRHVFRHSIAIVLR
jgi:hypothetical protein